MSIGFDPVVSSFLFSASLIPHAARPQMELEMPSRSSTDVPFVTVIVALYREKCDDIDRAQIENAARLMREKQYDAVQATVLRKGNSILSKFLFIDTAFWFRKYIPFVLKLARGMPLSGEGLFVRTSVLNEVGGFPEVLTEDALLGLMLTERGKRFGLVASVITEKAPRNIRAHFVQRLRWNRGYLTCLWRLIRSDLSFG